MTLKDIVGAYLIKWRYDGLYNTDAGCACKLSNLMPCDQPGCSCEPGYLRPCDCGEGCSFHIGSKWHKNGEGEGQGK